jgi:hypothetical protein
LTVRPKSRLPHPVSPGRNYSPWTPDDWVIHRHDFAQIATNSHEFRAQPVHSRI